MVSVISAGTVCVKLILCLPSEAHNDTIHNHKQIHDSTNNDIDDINYINGISNVNHNNTTIPVI